MEICVGRSWLKAIEALHTENSHYSLRRRSEDWFVEKKGKLYITLCLVSIFLVRESAIRIESMVVAM